MDNETKQNFPAGEERKSRWLTFERSKEESEKENS